MGSREAGCLVDTDALPHIPKCWGIRALQSQCGKLVIKSTNGQLFLGGGKVAAFRTPFQKANPESSGAEILRDLGSYFHFEPLNANTLDFLLRVPDMIPSDLLPIRLSAAGPYPKLIFPGTEYDVEGLTCVRYLYRKGVDAGVLGVFDWHYLSIDRVWDGACYVAIRGCPPKGLGL